jgi:hypothetical protein
MTSCSSAASEAREKQRLFNIWIKCRYATGFAGGRPSSGCKPLTRQRLEPALGFRDGLSIARFERVPTITGVVHHNLDRHGSSPEAPWPERYEANSVPVENDLIYWHGDDDRDPKNVFLRMPVFSP